MAARRKPAALSCLALRGGTTAAAVGVAVAVVVPVAVVVSAETIRQYSGKTVRRCDGEIEIIMSGVGRFWRSGRRIAHNLAQ